MMKKIAAFALVIAATCHVSMAGAETVAGGGPGAAAPGRGAIAGINPAALAALNLTEEQRAKVTEVQRGLQRAQWARMGALRELRWKHRDALDAPDFDPDAARKQYEAMAAIRKEMFEASLDARLRIEAVLTREQRQQLHQRRAPPIEGGRGAVPQ